MQAIAIPFAPVLSNWAALSFIADLPRKEGAVFPKLNTREHGLEAAHDRADEHLRRVDEIGVEDMSPVQLAIIKIKSIEREQPWYLRLKGSFMTSKST